MLKIEGSGNYLISLFLTSTLFLFWYKEFWNNTCWFVCNGLKINQEQHRILGLMTAFDVNTDWHGVSMQLQWQVAYASCNDKKLRSCVGPVLQCPLKCMWQFSVPIIYFHIIIDGTVRQRFMERETHGTPAGHWTDGS